MVVLIFVQAFLISSKAAIAAENFCVAIACKRGGIAASAGAALASLTRSRASRVYDINVDENEPIFIQSAQEILGNNDITDFNG
jgi:hypothetical protein